MWKIVLPESNEPQNILFGGSCVKTQHRVLHKKGMAANTPDSVPAD